MFRCPGQDRRNWRPDDVFEHTCPHCGGQVEFMKTDAKRACPDQEEGRTLLRRLRRDSARRFAREHLPKRSSREEVGGGGGRSAPPPECGHASP